MIEGFQLSPQQKHLCQRIHQHPAFPKMAIFSVEIEGEVVDAQWQEAFDFVCQQHESLRTEFHKIPGMDAPVQTPGEFELKWLETKFHQQPICQTQLHLQIFDRAQKQCAKLQARLHRHKTDAIVITLVAPRLCLDKNSFIHLIKQTLTVYAQLDQGQVANLAEPPQYIDIADWLNDLQTAPEAQPGRDFWEKNRDDHIQNIFELPQEAHKQTGFQLGTTQPVHLSPHLTDALKRIASKWETTPAALMFSLWHLVLARYANGHRLTTWVSFDGRLDEELKNVIGPLGRQVPVMVCCQPDQSLQAFTQAVTANLKEAFAWQECFAWDSFAANQNTAIPTIAFDYVDLDYSQKGLTLGQAHFTAMTDMFDLQLVCTCNQNRIHFYLVSNSACISTQLSQALSQQLEQAVQHLATNQATRLRNFDLFSSGQMQALKLRYQGPRKATATTTIADLIDDQAEITGDAVALAQGNRFLTYRALGNASNQFAKKLQRTRPGHREYRIAMLMNRNLDSLVSILAILKAGATYLPLDPSSPRNRLDFLLSDAQPQVIVTQPQLTTRIPTSFNGEVIMANSAIHLKASGDLNQPFQQQAAYMIYTSGTTGKPKGVLISHLGITNHALHMVSAFDLRASDRMLAFASFAFDAVLDQIFPPLIAGATLVLKPDQIWDTQDFDGHLRRDYLTHVNLPTPFWQAWSKARQDATGNQSSHLRVVIAGGDTMDTETARIWQIEIAAGSESPFRLINAYGPTEATITALTHHLNPTDTYPTTSVPIGKPLVNRDAWLINHRGRLVPQGVAGELHIGGASLARGYFKLPRLTAQSFIPDDLSGEFGARRYRSGDRAILTSQDQMVFLGRSDHQIKIRGYRVELGEIETHLMQHPHIEQAAVIAWADGELSDQKTLVGYYTVTPGGADPTGQTLAQVLKSTLPEYMVPAHFVCLPHLPKLTSGKIDRKALPKPSHQSKQDGSLQAIDASHIKLLGDIWKTLLHQDRFTAESNYFEMGGHSLNAMQLVSRIRLTFKINLTLQNLFANPKFCQQVNLIEAGLRLKENLTPLPPLEPIERTDRLPLSFAQHRLWLACQLDPGNSAYHMPTTLMIKGEFRKEIFEFAVSQVIARHENLRVSFSVADDEPFQTIRPPQPWQLKISQAASFPQSEPQAKVDAWLQNVQEQPFHLEKDLLLRGYLLELEAQTFYLHFNMHHIISDGWSIGILIREVLAFYQSKLTDQSANLPPLPIQYVDYAAWQRKWLDPEINHQHLAYWQQYLANAPTRQALPYDHDPQCLGKGSHPAGCERFKLAPETTQDLNQFAVEHQLTPFMLLLTAFNMVIHYMTDSRDLVIGTDVANRNRQEEENLIGFFINQIMFRTEVNPKASFLEHLYQTRRDAFSNFAHQDLPFDKIVEHLNPTRSAGITPFFQAKLVFQNAPTSQIALPDMVLEQLPQNVTTTKMNLQFNLWIHAGQLHGMLKYKNQCFEKTGIQRICRLFGWILSDAIQQPQLSVEDLCQKLKTREAAFREARLAELKTQGFKSFKSMKPKLS